MLRERLTQVAPLVAVDTGQHYDHALHQIHYEQLGVRRPDAFLGVGSGSHGQQTAAILRACEDWIARHTPRLAVVIGDTNSTLACTLAAAAARVPVAHVEAGLRATDRRMAEEINRRVVDAVADVLYAPCERVAALLRGERPEAVVEQVGDISYDVLRGNLGRVPVPEAVSGYDPAWGSRFAFVTLHRPELVEVPERLRAVMGALKTAGVACLFAAHPRTAAALERFGIVTNGRIRRIPPVGYLESLALLQRAGVVVTDSGGLQREAYWLGVPCVTVRDETEWLETVTLGANRLIAPDRAAALPDAIATALGAGRADASWDRGAYGDGRAADRIAASLAAWAGA